MKTIKTISILMLPFLLSSCFAKAKDLNGKEITKQVQTKNFSSIELKGAADIIYTQGKISQVSVTAPEKIINLIDVSFSNQKLIISTKKLDRADINSNYKITVKVSSPDLTGIDVMGAGDISLNGVCRLNQLTLTSKGAGDLKAENLHCKDLYLDIKGAGDIRLNGEAQKATFMVKGAGDIDAFNFKVGSLVVEMKGVGDIRCNANEISMDNSGAGDISYKGNPVIKKMNNRGVGDIKQVK